MKRYFYDEDSDELLVYEQTGNNPTVSVLPCIGCIDDEEQDEPEQEPKPQKEKPSGVKRGRLSGADQLKIRLLRKQGKNSQEIADLVGISLERANAEIEKLSSEE